MTLSPLATDTWPLGKMPDGKTNRFTRRSGKPQGFIVHHAAGTSDAGLKSQYVARHRQLSSNYAMTQNGDIIRILHEEYRPFTSSSSRADNWGITIEIVNETGAPSWKISDRAFDQLARLIADCANRWGFPINRQTVIGHREVIGRFGQGIATACPGPWLYGRMDELVARARKYQAGPLNPPAPTPKPPAKTPEQIEEEEIMAAADDIKQVVRRESRLRLREHADTGEIMLESVKTGYVETWHPRERPGWENELTRNNEAILTQLEVTNRPKIDDAQWRRIIELADVQLDRIAEKVADLLVDRGKA